MTLASSDGKGALRAITIAWLVTAIYYFYQYVMRSAPAVMVPELTDAFGVSAVGLASLVGLFYFGYAPFSLVAGVAMDQLGPRSAVPLGAATVGVGALLFATGDPTIASIGRFLQGAGGVFALIGATYIVTTNFPASRVATLIGVTQMFGMAGGSAGQFLVGPAIASGVQWDHFWLVMGVAGLLIAALLLALIPRREPAPAAPQAHAHGGWLKDVGVAFGSVATNPQSILCGLIAGLMFIPTTIFDMVWGVRFLQEAHDMPYTSAVMRSAAVPFGWIIGCPLMGAVSDRIGRRKPVIIAGASGLLICLVLILYGPPGLLPPYLLGLFTGIASGAAMIPYTVIKEANRPEYSGTATGVVNFINFSLSALLGPVFGGLLMRASGGGERELGDYQVAFEPLIYGVGLAIILTLFLRETGTASRPVAAPAT
ncbi:MFS transporter [Sphingomonas sp. LaA6.9]|uniref:MFS transporter n=1 Tax=Sphingomonas sp. LaA6.9 TaxID=2919914 RepID=UPI001F4FA922|nr:MFS transporter [Sphingomonas sp. LaA6.9]MCJ8156976.1 MFS transporter [Sphingomonas sp. LaA6.9]